MLKRNSLALSQLSPSIFGTIFSNLISVTGNKKNNILVAAAAAAKETICVTYLAGGNGL